jgi:hypothetical protein
MCDECVRLDKDILHFTKFVERPLDPLTIERLKNAIQEMEGRKAALHPE